MDFLFSNELKQIFDTKSGIFDNSMADSTRFRKLETAFANEKQRIENFTTASVAPDTEVLAKKEVARLKAISFKIPPLSIAALKESITALRHDPAQAGQPDPSHLGIFYGLTPDTNQIVLVMRGALLDGSDEGRKLHLPPTVVSKNQFTSLDLTPSEKPQPALRNRFKQAFRSIHGENNFVTGAYIQFEPLLNALSELEDQEKFPLLAIDFGYMSPIQATSNPFNLNCFHLIFRGLKADRITTSAKQFSTFDDLPGYSGPKPSCPPFGEVSE